MKMSGKTVDLLVVILLGAAAIWYTVVLYGYDDDFCKLFALPVTAITSILLIVELVRSITRTTTAESDSKNAIDIKSLITSPRILFGIWVIVFYLFINTVPYVFLAIVFCLLGPWFCKGSMKDCYNWKWVVFTIPYCVAIYYAFTEIMYTAIK